MEISEGSAYDKIVSGQVVGTVPPVARLEWRKKSELAS